MTDLSAAAQLLAVLEGWKVFPCRANKKPACKHGFKDATNDLDMIRELFTVPEAVAIGMPTGHVNKAVVIDIDVKNGKLGTKWYEAVVSTLYFACRRISIFNRVSALLPPAWTSEHVAAT